MTAPAWLRPYVESEMERMAKENAQLGAWLRTAGCIPLFNAIGEQAFLRPDGSVRYYRDPAGETNAERAGWSNATPKERIAALVLGARTNAKFAELLPVRPAGIAGCKTCQGRGEVALTRQPDDSERGILCPDCGGLGWWQAELEGPAAAG